METLSISLTKTSIQRVPFPPLFHVYSWALFAANQGFATWQIQSQSISAGAFPFLKVVWMNHIQMHHLGVLAEDNSMNETTNTFILSSLCQKKWYFKPHNDKEQNGDWIIHN